MDHCITRVSGADVPVKMFGLNTLVTLRFRGHDAKEARRSLYQFLRPHKPLFAGFGGPETPVQMSFHTTSGFAADGAIRLWHRKNRFANMEILARYVSFDDPEHQGVFKVGKRRLLSR